MIPRPPLLAVVAIVVFAARAGAQLPATSIELFGTAGAIAGITPLRVGAASRIGVHGGGRVDVGIQTPRLGYGIGARYWELIPTQQFGGHGLDVFFLSEWRQFDDHLLSARVAFGTGFDDIDGGRGPQSERTSTSGVHFSVGLARELIFPSGGRGILSLDLVMPNVNTDVSGRRQPVVEVGFGYRIRAYHPIEAIGVPRTPGR